MAESALERLAKRLEQRKETARSQGAPRYTVVICDDESRNVEALERVLRDQYTVASFTSAEQALEAIRSGAINPDLVLTDQRMPGMEGVELLEKIWELKPSCMRIILSGFAEKADLISAINRGHVYHYVTKPWFGEELLHTVGKALEHYQLQIDQDALNEKLRDTNQKLAAANVRLEDLVQQRTNALQQVNTQLHQVNEQLAKLAITDPLTGLYNQRFFQDFLARELKRSSRYGQPLTVVMADIDHFKEYNDQQGHPAGDKVLKRLAEILRTHIREPDVAARYGGEEFIAILPQTDSGGGVVAAERLRVSIAAYPFPNREDQPQSRLTASFGVATFEPASGGKGVEEIGPSELISRADRALYQSKRSGRDRVTVFSPEVSG